MSTPTQQDNDLCLGVVYGDFKFDNISKTCVFSLDGKINLTNLPDNSLVSIEPSLKETNDRREKANYSIPHLLQEH